MSDSYELFKLRTLLPSLDGENAKIVREAIWRMADLEHQVARDDELWRGITVHSTQRN